MLPYENTLLLHMSHFSISTVKNGVEDKSRKNPTTSFNTKVRHCAQFIYCLRLNNFSISTAIKTTDDMAMVNRSSLNVRASVLNMG